MLIYRAITLLLAPLLALKFLLSVVRGRESRAELRERLALDGRSGPPAPRIWLHGASLGELTAARGLVQALLAQDDRLHFIITSNSTTARKMASGWNLPRTEVRLAPLDYPSIVRRFLATWHPGAYVVLENELWPVRMLEAHKSGLPIVWLTGRLSADSVRIWGWFGKLASRVMDTVAFLVPLDDINAKRFADLGLAPERIERPLNLKAGVALDMPDPEELDQFRAVFDRAATLLAASTHEGDDEIVLAGFARARLTRPDLRLIIAPRHPERAPQIEKLIARSGFTCQIRSGCREPARNADIYLADTLGDMALLYSVAGQTLMCGSFSDKGGHSPVEPVQFGSFVLHGPDTRNHAEAYEALACARAARRVENARELADVLSRPAPQTATGAATERARNALSGLRPEGADFRNLVRRLAALVHDAAT